MSNYFLRLMKKYKNFILFILVSLIVSCNDVFETDISNNSVQIIYPSDNTIVQNNIVNFQWEPVEDASEYQLQIFLSNRRKLMDTTIEAEEFSLPLNENNYIWRIRAKNFDYQTDFTDSIHFRVIIPVDLSNQTVVLTSPDDGIYLNTSDNLIFTWDDLLSADYYRFQIVKEKNGLLTILNEPNITDNYYNLANNLINNDNAIYHWKVKAFNSSSQTDFSERVFYIDTVKPQPVLLNLPVNDVTLNNLNVDFSWQTNPDTGFVQSPIHYLIIISPNSDLSNVMTQLQTNDTQISYVFPFTGSYYWTVIPIDGANNQGEISEIRHLEIN